VARSRTGPSGTAIAMPGKRRDASGSKAPLFRAGSACRRALIEAPCLAYFCSYRGLVAGLRSSRRAPDFSFKHFIIKGLAHSEPSRKPLPRRIWFEIRRMGRKQAKINTCFPRRSPTPSMLWPVISRNNSKKRFQASLLKSITYRNRAKSSMNRPFEINKIGRRVGIGPDAHMLFRISTKARG
jgi:hypothetical protein